MLETVAYSHSLQNGGDAEWEMEAFVAVNSERMCMPTFCTSWCSYGTCTATEYCDYGDTVTHGTFLFNL